MEHYYDAISHAGESENLNLQTKALLDVGIDFSKLSGAQQAMLRMANGEVQTDMSLLTPEQIAEERALERKRIEDQGIDIDPKIIKRII